MVRRLYGFIIVLLSLSGCGSENFLGEKKVLPYMQTVDSTTLVLGAIRIKVTESLANKIEISKDENGELISTSVKSVDDLIFSMGASRMERTFPYAGRFEARTRAEGLHLWYDVYFDKSVSITKAGSDFSKLPGVNEVEYRRKIRLIDTNLDDVLTMSSNLSSLDNSISPSATLPFNDPSLYKQWHYYNEGGTSSFLAGSDINVLPVWKGYTAGRQDVIVAIVDGGIDYTHEDLAGNIWINETEYNGARTIDDDGNGYKDDIYGFNFIKNTGTITPHNHGTHVAGTVGAVNNNGIGVCGVAGGNAANNIKGVKLMSCQIFSSEAIDDGEDSNTSAAIKYGADNGAVISQNSWGYSTAITIPSSIKAAIDYFVKYAGVDEFGNQSGPMKGGIVVFAAGNEERDAATPASYENVFSVASIGPDYVKATYSNFGSWVDISAPGGQSGKGSIYSTLPANSYGTMNGTSMACPHVSGVAALIVSYYGAQGFTKDMLLDRLVKGATNIDSYNRAYIGRMGSGLVNALASIATGSTIPPQRVTGLWGSSVSNNVNLKWQVTADSDDGKAFGYTVYYSKSPLTSLDRSNIPSTVKRASFETGDLNVGDTLKASIPALDFATKYYFVVDAYDYSSNRSDLSPMIDITTQINNPPVITPLNGTTATIKAYQTVYLNFTYSDPDKHNVTWSLVPGSNALSAIEINGKIQVTIVGRAVSAGTYSGKLTATDQFGAATTLTINYTIEKNVPPHTLQDPADICLGALAEMVTLNLDNFFIDDDGEPLTYTVVSSVPSVAHINPNESTLYLTAMGFGMSEIELTATDALNESCKVTFRVLVRDNTQEIDVYPNPVKDVLFLRMGSETNAVVSVIASNGAKVFNGNVTISPFAPAQINMSGMSGGAYSVIVKYNGKEVKRNIVKL